MSLRNVSSLSLGVITSLAATLCSTAAFAEDVSISTSAAPQVMRAQVQLELLPIGSAKGSIDGEDLGTEDAAFAYAISATLERTINKYLSIGIAPRLIFNVTGEEAGDDEDAAKELDARVRLLAHFPVAPKLEVYGSLTPGFTFLLPANDDDRGATGFAIGAAAGVTYDVSPSAFLNAELGYQRAFTSTDIMFLDQRLDVDVDVSYLHVGLGAGTRF